MLNPNALKDLLARDFSDLEKILFCLAIEPVTPQAVKLVVELAFESGWRQIKKKNVSSILSRSNGLAIRSADGWELTSDGKDVVTLLAGPAIGNPIPKTAFALRAHLSKISQTETCAFVEEAISCFEGHQFRGAVVLSWIGAVSILQDYIVSNKLAEFNAEAAKRNSRWKVAKSADDLGLMREDEFLDVLQAISVLGKSVKQELKKALSLRNGCGHPNSLKVAEHKVASHIEDLMLNVFAIFI